jgi:hypothetical protein
MFLTSRSCCRGQNTGLDRYSRAVFRFCSRRDDSSVVSHKEDSELNYRAQRPKTHAQGLIIICRRNPSKEEGTKTKALCAVRSRAPKSTCPAGRRKAWM